MGIIYEEKQLDLQSPSSSVVPLRQTREFSVVRDLPQGTAQFVAPLAGEPPPYWRSLWCNSDGCFYTISVKETTVAHRAFTTPDYMLCVSCLIILFLSQGWGIFSPLLFQCLAYKAEILQGWDLWLCLRHRAFCLALKACGAAKKSRWKISTGELPSQVSCKRRRVYSLHSWEDAWAFLRSVRTLASRRSLGSDKFCKGLPKPRGST